MKTKINGSTIEFHHPNKAEGKYYNETIHEFTNEQWEEKIEEMHSLNMEYVNILSSGTYGLEDEEQECYYNSDFFEKSKVVKASDPLEAILSKCDKLNMKVFMSAGFFSNYHKPWENMQNEQAYTRAFHAIDELHALYGHHKSFYGFYLPDELGIDKYFEEFFITYVNRYKAKISSLNPNYKLMVSPYGTRHIQVDDYFIDQLRRLDADIIAYQDEVGVRKVTEYQTAKLFENLKRAHDIANKSKLWADVETFDFEGDVYKSALIPGPIDRIKRQIEAVEPYVDQIIVFEYLATMNKPGTKAFCGLEESYKLYNDYKALLEKTNGND